MQIHELNEGFTDLLKGAGSKIAQAAQSAGDKIAASNVARGTAQQQKTQAQAAKYAERLKQQGYQVKQPPAAAAPEPELQPIQIGGQTINPNDPNYDKILSGLGQAAAKSMGPEYYTKHMQAVDTLKGFETQAGQDQKQAQKYAQSFSATNPQQPKAQTAPAGTAAAQPVQTKQAGPVRTRQAGPVYTGQAGAIMTAPDFQAALSQLGMNAQQIEKLGQTVQSNPAFANTLLKKLGLKR